jgi:hypothetical protein
MEKPRSLKSRPKNRLGGWQTDRDDQSVAFAHQVRPQTPSAHWFHTAQARIEGPRYGSRMAVVGRRFWAAITLGALLFGLGGALGAAAVRYEWPPYDMYLRMKLGEEVSTGEEDILSWAFNMPLAEADRLFPVVTSLQGIEALNGEIFVPLEDFWSAGRSIKLGSLERFKLDDGATRAVKGVFQLGGGSYSTYAYEILGDSGTDNNAKALLVIPGSGHNQSSQIYSGAATNYHFGVLDLVDDDTDTFIFVKPNEDFLAWHDGQGKLNTDFYVNWHLNHGGSYSASYLVQAIALTRFLQRNYDTVAITGLSQGGAAALQVALQTEPSVVLVASGYTALEESVMHSGHDQIIIPSHALSLDVDRLVTVLRVLDTRFLFTYGLPEAGQYKTEAPEGTSCRLLELEAENVRCTTHDGTHVFPSRSEVGDFLASG